MSKVTASDAIEITKLVGIAVGVFVLWRYGGAWFKPIKDSIESASAAAGTHLSDVMAWVNGYEPVAFTDARFFLKGSKVAADGTIDYQWRKALERSHEGIGQLFSQITDPLGRLLPEYQHLIDGEVSAATLNPDSITTAVVPMEDV